MQTASAFSVKEVNIPKADLKSNDNVKVELEMSLVSVTSSHDFQFASDLTGTICVVDRYNDEASQYETLQLDRDRSGNWILLGWILPTQDSSLVLRVTFTGKVPETSSTTNITLLRISELAAGSTVAGGEYILERPVANPQEITATISSVRTDLQKLKQTITTQAGAGVDTSPAASKATEAENALNKADSLKSTSFSQAQAQITSARTAIESGYSLLDKAGAQAEIDTVEKTMAEVEDMISYFTNNRSISQTDTRIVAITNKYDLASQSLSSANDMVNTGNYLGGKAKAVEASKYANDAFNLSTSMKAEIGEGGLPLPGINPLFLVVGIIVVVIGVAGYYAYRRFFHWDELG
jgi:hypothetical protein